jgi:hypothetical protein
MNEARIAQYLDLIQKLLSCLSEEDAEILQAHQKLSEYLEAYLWKQLLWCYKLK